MKNPSTKIPVQNGEPEPFPYQETISADDFMGEIRKLQKSQDPLTVELREAAHRAYIENRYSD